MDYHKFKAKRQNTLEEKAKILLGELGVESEILIPPTLQAVEDLLDKVRPVQSFCDPVRVETEIGNLQPCFLNQCSYADQYGCPFAGNILFCIVGRSGTGKTTLAENLETRTAMRQVYSYTTRPQRYEGETGHTFITEEEYQRMDPETIAALNQYNGYTYFATTKQLFQKMLYVVDIPGLKQVKENYHFGRIITIGLTGSRDVLADRMKDRGDSHEQIQRRLDLDDVEFSSVPEQADILINTDLYTTEEVVEKVLQEIRNIL